MVLNPCLYRNGGTEAQSCVLASSGLRPSSKRQAVQFARRPAQPTNACTRKEFILGGLCLVASQQFILPANALGLSCQGLKPYEMKKCLRERQEAEVRPKDPGQTVLLDIYMRR